MGGRYGDTMELPPPPVLQIERAVAPIAFPDPALEKALRGFLFPSGSPARACHGQGGARYIFNRLDLDGDRQPETLVALLGQRRCGAAGCPLLILRNVGERFVPLQKIEGLQASLVVSERASHGWRDLILPPPEDGAGRFPRRLVHDGARYSGGTTAAGSVPLREPTRGVAALWFKTSPFLVQGHLLPCAPPPLDQRNKVLSRVPMARPRLSPLAGSMAEDSRPAVWVATNVMSAQRKMPVAP